MMKSQEFAPLVRPQFHCSSGSCGFDADSFYEDFLRQGAAMAAPGAELDAVVDWSSAPPRGGSWPSPPPAAPLLTSPSWAQLSACSAAPAVPAPAHTPPPRCSSFASALDTFDSDTDDLDSWRQRHPMQWTSVDVLNFIFSLPPRFPDQFALQSLRGENFQGVTGPDLYRMHPGEFVRRDPRHGQLLYAYIRKHLDTVGCSGSDPAADTKFYRSSSMTSMDADQRLSPVDGLRSFRQLLPKPVEDVISMDCDETCNNSTVRVGVGQQHQQSCRYDLVDADLDLDPCSLPQPASGVMTSLTSFQRRPVAGVETLASYAASQQNSISGSDGYNGVRSYADPSESYVYRSPPAYRGASASAQCDRIPLSVVRSDPGFCRAAGTSPRSDSCSDSSCASSSPGTESSFRAKSAAAAAAAVARRPYARRRASCPEAKQRAKASSSLPRQRKASLTGGGKRTEPGKGGHLWEFIRRLLGSSDSAADRIIQWEDRSEGVFRIVNSRAVAKLWGEQKDNRKTKMTYEKLSRALRWCRTDGFLANVPKDGRFPKKLCFRFGPKASNWSDEPTD